MASGKFLHTNGHLKDFYRELNVARQAKSSEIKVAYHKAALQYHPDRNFNNGQPVDQNKFQRVQEAYEILSDERERALYDAAVKIRSPGIGGAYRNPAEASRSTSDLAEEPKKEPTTKPKSRSFQEPRNPNQKDAFRRMYECGQAERNAARQSQASDTPKEVKLYIVRKTLHSSEVDGTGKCQIMSIQMIPQDLVHRDRDSLIQEASLALEAGNTPGTERKRDYIVSWDRAKNIGNGNLPPEIRFHHSMTPKPEIYVIDHVRPVLDQWKPSKSSLHTAWSILPRLSGNTHCRVAYTHRVSRYEPKTLCRILLSDAPKLEDGDNNELVEKARILHAYPPKITEPFQCYAVQDIYYVDPSRLSSLNGFEIISGSSFHQLRDSGDRVERGILVYLRDSHPKSALDWVRGRYTPIKDARKFSASEYATFFDWVPLYDQPPGDGFVTKPDPWARKEGGKLILCSCNISISSLLETCQSGIEIDSFPSANKFISKFLHLSGIEDSYYDPFVHHHVSGKQDVDIVEQWKEAHEKAFEKQPKEESQDVVQRQIPSFGLTQGIDGDLADFPFRACRVRPLYWDEGIQITTYSDLLALYAMGEVALGNEANATKIGTTTSEAKPPYFGQIETAYDRAVRRWDPMGRGNLNPEQIELYAQRLLLIEEARAVLEGGTKDFWSINPRKEMFGTKDSEFSSTATCIDWREPDWVENGRMVRVYCRSYGILSAGRELSFKIVPLEAIRSVDSDWAIQDVEIQFRNKQGILCTERLYFTDISALNMVKARNGNGESSELAYHLLHALPHPAPFGADYDFTEIKPAIKKSPQASQVRRDKGLVYLHAAMKNSEPQDFLCTTISFQSLKERDDGFLQKARICYRVPQHEDAPFRYIATRDIYYVDPYRLADIKTLKDLPSVRSFLRQNFLRPVNANTTKLLMLRGDPGEDTLDAPRGDPSWEFGRERTILRWEALCSGEEDPELPDTIPTGYFDEYRWRSVSYDGPKSNGQGFAVRRSPTSGNHVPTLEILECWRQIPSDTLFTLCRGANWPSTGEILIKFGTSHNAVFECAKDNLRVKAVSDFATLSTIQEESRLIGGERKKSQRRKASETKRLVYYVDENGKEMRVDIKSISDLDSLESRLRTATGQRDGPMFYIVYWTEDLDTSYVKLRPPALDEGTEVNIPFKVLEYLTRCLRKLPDEESLGTVDFEDILPCGETYFSRRRPTLAPRLTRHQRYGVVPQRMRSIELQN